MIIPLTIFTLSAYLGMLWARKYPLLYAYHCVNSMVLVLVCAFYGLWMGILLFGAAAVLDLFLLYKHTWQ